MGHLRKYLLELTESRILKLQADANFLFSEAIKMEDEKEFLQAGQKLSLIGAKISAFREVIKNINESNEQL